METLITRRKSLINTWKPRPDQVYVEPDGKKFICHFDRILDNPNFINFNVFIINKGSYENQLDIITRYINFFMNVYDPDNELVLSYLKCQVMLLDDRRFSEKELNSFIDFIYEIMFTPSIVKKITKMVDDNYLDDIESNTEEKKKYMKNEKKHLESLEFTNQHIKILLRISFGMKIMSPVLFHYLYLNHIKIDKDSETIFYFYKKLFTIFGYSNLYEYYDERGNLIEKGIDPKVIEDGLNECIFCPVEKGYETYYYLDDNSYYTLGKINMYNKLFVYVENALAQTLINLSNCWNRKESAAKSHKRCVQRLSKRILMDELSRVPKGKREAA